MKSKSPDAEFTALRAFVAILAILAAIGLGALLPRRYARSRAEARFRSSLPKLREELDRHRQVLTSAIAAYRQALGCYPPDHVVGRSPLVVDAVTNQLVYELLGSVYDPTNQVFFPTGFPPIRKTDVKAFFGADSLKNSSTTPSAVKCFLNRSELSSVTAIAEKPDTVALLSFWPNWPGVDPNLYRQIHAGTWCYNSSAPVQNPGTYDLWIEIKTPLTNIVVRNW